MKNVIDCIPQIWTCALLPHSPNSANDLAVALFRDSESKAATQYILENSIVVFAKNGIAKKIVC